MHAGLISGIGPAATDFYYRGLINAMKANGERLDLTMVHADAPTLVRNFEARRPEEQAEIFLRLTERLARAGADFIAITSIGGHFCIEQFRRHSPLRIIDLIAEMNGHLLKQRYQRVGLLGTDTVMKTRFYGGVTSTDILVPPPAVIDHVHRAYVDMALAASVNAEQRKVFIDAGKALADRGAETILLGGTDLFLTFDGQALPFETLDCASVHIDAIARAASQSQSPTSGQRAG